MKTSPIPSLVLVVLFSTCHYGWALLPHGRSRNFGVVVVAIQQQRTQIWQPQSAATLRLSGWSDFQALDPDDDDDDVVFGRRIDRNDYAGEDDSQDFKSQVGSALEPPSIEQPANPIQVPAGWSNVGRMLVGCWFTNSFVRKRGRSSLLPRFLLNFFRLTIGIKRGNCVGRTKCLSRRIGVSSFLWRREREMREHYFCLHFTYIGCAVFFFGLTLT